MTEPAVNMGNLNPNPNSTPELVEVKVGDKTLKLPKDAADAITASDAASKAAIKAAQDAAIAAEAKATEAANKAAGAAPAAEANMADALANVNLLFTNPEEFLAKFGQKIKDEVMKEVSTAYTHTRQQEQFWQEFYTKHTDLKAHDFYVRAVLNREMPSYQKLTVGEVITKLGETVKGDLLKLAGKPTGTPGSGRPVTEGGTERSVAMSKSGSEDSLQPQAGSLSSLLRERRASRHKGGASKESK